MDTSYQILVLARRISGMGATHMLQKVKFRLIHAIKRKTAYTYFQVYSCSGLLCLIYLGYLLSQINLICPLESEDIQLPQSTKAIKDLCVSPCGRLTLLASLGKKLSILRFAYSILANVILDLRFSVGIYLFCFLFQPGKQQLCHQLRLTGTIGFSMFYFSILKTNCC